MANSTKNTYKPSKKGNYMPVIRMEDGGNVSELNYSERREYIEENYAPFITEAQMIFSIWDSSIEYDYKADRKEVVNKIIESYKELGDYTEKTLSQETIYEIQDWDLIRRDIDPETDEVIGETTLKEISADNTYNFSYKGLVDLNWKVYHDEEYDRYFYVVTPHLGGDIRGNYGDAIILEGSDKEELFYRFYEGFISGGASFYFKFKDGSEIGFDSEQDSDVFNFRVSESFEPTGMAQKYLNDFEKFDSWKGDEFLEETIDIYLMRKGIAPKMMAGGSLNDETPKAYIQILGYDEGKWFNLTDYSDGQDVIDGIYDLMNDLNKELGGNREEYSVTDYEGFGDDLYDEYMGANEFDEIIEAYEKYQSSDFPADVISAYKNDSGRSNDTLSEIIDQMDNNFFGKYENLNDFGYEMVEQGVYSPSDNDVFITDTDKRIIAGEESDASIDGMSFDDLLKIAETTKSDYEDEKSELEDKISNIESEINDLNELQKSVDDDSEYEKISEEVEDKEIELNDLEIELNDIDSRYEDKAREEARDVFYDEIYDKLDNDLSSWLEDYGYTSDLSSLSFLSVDYEKIGEEISSDYLVVEFDGDMYFFNNYKKGGRIMASKRKPKYAYYIVENSTKKLVSGYPSKPEAIEQRKLLIQQYPSMRFEIYTLANLESKTDLDVYAKKDYVELSTLDKIKKVSVDALRYGKDKFGQAQMFLQKNDVKGRINRGARKVIDKSKQGADWLRNKWLEADFGDGTGRAKFFADGGELQSLQESLLNAEKNYRKAQQSERVGIINATELEKSKQKYESIRTKINDWYASKQISENKFGDGDIVDADYSHKKHEDSETAEEEIAEHEYDIYDNKRMLENQSNEIEHHSEELSEQVAKTKKVPAWVIAKMERATTDLSDITHYLDGENKMANGGNVGDVNYEIIPLPSSEKFIIVQVTNIGNKEDENIIRDFNGQVMKFDSINSAQKFIDNIDIKYPYGVAKANVGAILMASQLLQQQQQQQSQLKQPQIVYYIPQPNEQFQDEVIIQNIPEMEHGGEAESPVINDFCMTNLIELANDIQSVRYFLTDRFKESDFESEKYKGKLIIVFKEPASVSVVNALSQFIENAVDCHHIFEQSVNVSGTEPNSLSINLLTDKYSDREFKKGGKVYDFAPKKINLEKTKKITTDLGDYNLGLITNDFVYFVNSQEGDENASTIMYNKKGELLSDNYFASSDLFEKLESGDTFEFIHPDIEAYRQEIINGN